MTLDEIRAAFDAARVIRIPRFDPNTHGRVKVSALETYINDTAFHRGELEDALWWTWEAERTLRDQWDDVEGYEPFLPSTAKERTQEAISKAKRRVNPDVYDGLKLCAQLREAIGRQIRRLEKDYDAASRQYSLVTGS